MTLTPRRPVFDANATGGAFGDLPDWDLSDLYAAPDAPELAADMSWLETHCAAFARDYEGKLAELDAAGMAECIARYEEIDEKAGRIMSYVGLRYYQNTGDVARVKQMADAQDKITGYTTPLVFFSLEFNRIEDAHYETVFADPRVSRYKPVFDRMRAMKPYQLSDELEKFLHDQSVVGAAAWNRLFDETTAALEFDVLGETLSLEATTTLLSDHDRARREAAAHALARVFKDNIRTFSRIHNTLAKEKDIEDRWRKMPTPQTGRHLSNDVEAEVVQALRESARIDYCCFLEFARYALGETPTTRVKARLKLAGLE